MVKVDVGADAREGTRVVHGTFTGEIIAAAVDVHRELGHELTKRELHPRTEVSLPIKYKSISLDCGYRMNLVVEDKNRLS